MAVTTKSHMKFDDIDEDLSMPSKPMSETTKSTDKYAVSDSDDSDMDEDAPEEGAMDESKESVDQFMKMAEDARRLEEVMLKEKRRNQNKIFSKQQQDRRERKGDTLDSANTEATKQLEQLPEDFFDKLEAAESNIETITEIPKHINFNSIEHDDKYVSEVKEQIKKKKKKTLRKLRAVSTKKGPVTVSLLSAIGNSSTMAPKKEVQVMSTRDRWLKRKSVNRLK
ncbi:hypothetical protein TPHA_0H01390 [Tetrapisispora phaffii CBS 4417]|uniref:Uncharacterized protein n=1 Tax=Tetrapisispora phaffii (strain ATCC 24235 / CBS 4417 / NBRC 1672 / NRRL Y-8282 / UCD 70-5) TaxID=1071381 RepID=G8BX41_TETPH|nr:hypothetical protein TPHA_0H01390 [Tetrapisispora phaffii CBS 4417]CCE64345.1 hypothetical protein TPHA_0H01390 [Tetrapisispora phaffii CBS 4417]